MFTDDELKATKDYCDRKIDHVLNSDDGSYLDYIENLQTLIKLKESANKAIKPTAKACDCEDGVYPGSIEYCVACGKDL